METTERFHITVSKKTLSCENIQSRILAEERGGEGVKEGVAGGWGVGDKKENKSPGNKIVMQNVSRLQLSVSLPMLSITGYCNRS